MAKPVDSVIEASWIICVDEDNRVLEDHSLVIHEGKILDILPHAQAKSDYEASTLKTLPGHALIPGLINAHTHAAMNLMRGLADDLPLMEWLQNHIWPAEATWVNSEFVHDGSQLAIAEMIKSGTTCFNDMYFFPDVTARAADAAGIRANIGLIVIDFPTVWAQDSDEYLSKAIEVHDQFRGHPLINSCFAPHAPYTVSDEPLKRILRDANEIEIPIHMHIHETAHEVHEAETESGMRPLQRLEQLGLINPQLIAVHMTQLNEDEIAMLATNGVNVVHCPESNMKLASGFCPVDALLKAGVNVALGTDGVASNNDLDMFGEMRSAALIAKAVAADASALPAEQALRMATINGARAMGIDTLTGSLEIGKAADVTAVDLSSLENQPLYHPVSQLIYSTGRQHVTNVWVAGRQLLHDRQLTTLDEKTLIIKAKEWQAKIAQNS